MFPINTVHVSHTQRYFWVLLEAPSKRLHLIFWFVFFMRNYDIAISAPPQAPYAHTHTAHTHTHNTHHILS